jgi:peptidoglycan/xylan/chitin deacetylase (PgdA/CDA1 family)
MRAVQGAVLTAGLAGLASAHVKGKRGTIPYDGTIWTACTTPGVVALTFDDGPYIYTQEIVDQLTAAGQRATFFQNGQNWDSIYNYNSTLQSMIAGGHQIASHTWDHADLATLDAAGITSEMTQLETAHQAIIGMSPNYMRPPYLSTNDLVIDTIKGLGYLIIEVDVDTQDWAEGPIGEIDLSIQWYEGNQTAGGTLSLNHDPYQPTAETFLPAILSYLSSKGLQSVTVGECLGDDPANWYRGGSVSTTNTTTTTTTTTTGPSNSTTTGTGTGTGGKGGAPSGSPKGSGVPVWTNTPPTTAKGWGGWKPSSEPCGGDTQPGHGGNSGRGALPGHGGQGNNPVPGWSGNATGNGNGNNGGHSGGSGPSGSVTGAVSGHGSGNSSNPAYYVNGAGSLSVSAAMLVGAAVLGFFL